MTRLGSATTGIGSFSLGSDDMEHECPECDAVFTASEQEQAYILMGEEGAQMRTYVRCTVCDHRILKD